MSERRRWLAGAVVMALVAAAYAVRLALGAREDSLWLGLPALGLAGLCLLRAGGRTPDTRPRLALAVVSLLLGVAGFVGYWSARLTA